MRTKRNSKYKPPYEIQDFGDAGAIVTGDISAFLKRQADAELEQKSSIEEMNILDAMDCYKFNRKQAERYVEKWNSSVLSKKKCAFEILTKLYLYGHNGKYLEFRLEDMNQPVWTNYLPAIEYLIKKKLIKKQGTNNVYLTTRGRSLCIKIEDVLKQHDQFMLDRQNKIAKEVKQ